MTAAREAELPATGSHAVLPATGSHAEPNALLAIGRSVLHILGRTVAAWRVGVVILLLGVPAAYVAPRFMKPVYRSETLLAYRESIRTSGEEERENSRRVGAKLREILLSRSKLEEIVKDLHLYPESRDPVEAVDRFRLAIQFKSNEDTFGVSYETDSAELARKVTTRLADGLMEESSRLRRDRAQATKEFLDEQKQRNDDELRTQERRLADFVHLHPEFATATNGPRAGSGRVAEGPTAALERQAARLRERIAPTPKRGAGPPVVSAPLPTKLDEEVAAAQRQLDEKRQRFTDQHPDVVEAQKKLAKLRAQRAQEVRVEPPSELSPNMGPVAELSEAEKQQIRAQLTRLQVMIADARDKGKAGAAPTSVNEGESIARDETEWTRLQRDVQEARERNTQLEGKLFKATLAMSVEELGGAAQLLVVDAAYLPFSPIRNSKNRVLAGGIGIAIALGLVAMFIAGQLDTRILRASQIDALGVSRLVLLVPLPRGALPKRKLRHG